MCMCLCVCVCDTIKKISHKLAREQGEVYSRVYKEEREGENDVTIL